MPESLGNLPQGGSESPIGAAENLGMMADHIMSQKVGADGQSVRGLIEAQRGAGSGPGFDTVRQEYQEAAQRVVGAETLPASPEAALPGAQSTPEVAPGAPAVPPQTPPGPAGGIAPSGPGPVAG